MSEDSQRPIVIKRVRRDHGAHHGGAWKIAYADFVTAMMAFFLLMWLLGTATAGDLKGISEYFQMPLKVALMGGKTSGDRDSVIQGGGRDLTRTDGQVKYGSVTPAKKVVDFKAAEVALAQQEKNKLRRLQERIERAIESNAALKQFRKQLLIDLTDEGLRIQIVDENNRPMFAMGSARLQPYTREILREISKVLNGVPNRISISGHTDAAPYSGGEKGYSNWELSADRANAARRELVGDGLQEGRVLRVVGLGSAVPFDADNPLNPINRRISIIVMNKKTEEAVTKASGAPKPEPSSGIKIEAKPEIKPEVAPQTPPQTTPVAKLETASETVNAAPVAH